MNTATIRLSAAGLVVALVGLLGAWYLRQRQAELRVLEATVREELAANRRQREVVRAAQAKAAIPRMAEIPAPPPSLAPTEAPPASNLAVGGRMSDALRSHPGYAPFQQRFIRRSVLRYNGDLLAELKLSPERAEALKQLLGDRFQAGMDVMSAAYQQGYKQGSPEFSRMYAETEKAYRAKIDAMLSLEEQGIFARCEKTSSWRNSRQPELDEFVADRGLPPLTATQKQTLAAAYFEARNWKPDPTEGNLTKVAIERRCSELMVRLASPALDPKQRVVLSEYLEFNYSRGEIMGRLYNPERPPGSVFYTVSTSRP